VIGRLDAMPPKYTFGSIFYGMVKKSELKKNLSSSNKGNFSSAI